MLPLSPSSSRVFLDFCPPTFARGPRRVERERERERDDEPRAASSSFPRGAPTRDYGHVDGLFASRRVCSQPHSPCTPRRAVFVFLSHKMAMCVCAPLTHHSTRAKKECTHTIFDTRISPPISVSLSLSSSSSVLLPQAIDQAIGTNSFLHAKVNLWTSNVVVRGYPSS